MKQKNLIKILTAVLLSAALLVFSVGMSGRIVNGEPIIIASGSDGGVGWKLNSEGLLEVTITGDLSYEPGYDPEISNWRYWPWYDEKEAIKKAVVSGSNLVNAQYMFIECDSMTEVDLTNLNTNDVKSMKSMFSLCASLKNVNLSGNHTPHLEDMSYMFSECNSLESLNLKNFDTGSVKDISGMLNYCSELKSLDLCSFDLSKLEYGNDMLTGCDGLMTIKTPNVLSSKYTIYLPDKYLNKDGVESAMILDANDIYTRWDAPQEATLIMYRLYNPNSGEHFYTSNKKEVKNVVAAGWKNEGLAWKAPEKSSTPVYRLYNPNAGDHHYTMSAKEKNNLVALGWNYEGIGWYSDDNKTAPLYRLYNPNAVAGSHHYTMSKAERSDLIKAGWKDEGIAWYGR